MPWHKRADRKEKSTENEEIMKMCRYLLIIKVFLLSFVMPSLAIADEGERRILQDLFDGIMSPTYYSASDAAEQMFNQNEALMSKRTVPAENFEYLEYTYRSTDVLLKFTVMENTLFIEAASFDELRSILSEISGWSLASAGSQYLMIYDDIPPVIIPISELSNDRGAILAFDMPSYPLSGIERAYLNLLNDLVKFSWLVGLNDILILNNFHQVSDKYFVRDFFGGERLHVTIGDQKMAITSNLIELNRAKEVVEYFFNYLSSNSALAGADNALFLHNSYGQYSGRLSFLQDVRGEALDIEVPMEQSIYISTNGIRLLLPDSP